MICRGRGMVARGRSRGMVDRCRRVVWGVPSLAEDCWQKSSNCHESLQEGILSAIEICTKKEIECFSSLMNKSGMGELWCWLLFFFYARLSRAFVIMLEARKSPASSLGVVRLASAGVLVDGGSYIARRETP